MREGREKNIERFVNRRCLELVTQEDTATGQGKRVIEGLQFIEFYAVSSVTSFDESASEQIWWEFCNGKHFKTTHL